jgi:hypothetical protein
MPGDVIIKPYAILTTLDGEEILAQCYANNRLFVGEDGRGSHARIYIEDEELRKEVGFDTDGNPQHILKEEDILQMFSLKTFKAFEKNVTQKVVTLSEKHFLMEIVKKHKFNDHDKVVFASEYCRIPLK